MAYEKYAALCIKRTKRRRCPVSAKAAVAAVVMVLAGVQAALGGAVVSWNAAIPPMGGVSGFPKNANPFAIDHFRNEGVPKTSFVRSAPDIAIGYRASDGEFSAALCNVFELIFTNINPSQRCVKPEHAIWGYKEKLRRRAASFYIYRLFLNPREHCAENRLLQVCRAAPSIYNFSRETDSKTSTAARRHSSLGIGQLQKWTAQGPFQGERAGGSSCGIDGSVSSNLGLLGAVQSGGRSPLSFVQSHSQEEQPDSTYKRSYNGGPQHTLGPVRHLPLGVQILLGTLGFSAAGWYGAVTLKRFCERESDPVTFLLAQLVCIAIGSLSLMCLVGALVAF